MSETDDGEIADQFEVTGAIFLNGIEQLRHIDSGNGAVAYGLSHRGQRFLASTVPVHANGDPGPRSASSLAVAAPVLDPAPVVNATLS